MKRTMIAALAGNIILAGVLLLGYGLDSNAMLYWHLWDDRPAPVRESNDGKVTHCPVLDRVCEDAAMAKWQAEHP